MMAYTYNPKDWEREARDQKFKAILSFKVNSDLSVKQQQNDVWG